MSGSDKQLWLQMWRDGKTDFHQTLVDSLLERYWGTCSSKQPKSVFIPMCGKSMDILWLAQLGIRVVAVEYSPVAVKAFFNENNLKVRRRRESDFVIWESENIQIYCGDYFQLKASDLGQIDIVYDRAALTALPESLRVDYITHMHKIMPNISEVFLLTTEDFLADSAVNKGEIDPEIQQLYEDLFDITLIHAEREMLLHSDNATSQPPSVLKLYDMQLKT